ncbi:MAG: hypothetical protein QM278_02275 [Pseudomonadota bacterium]|nr:hypothetical protein [Pseudomonadota bacterium]
MEVPISRRRNKDGSPYLTAERGQKSHLFYRRLAEIHPPGKARDLLARRANEEFKHKEKMEHLYDNTVFAQTEGG